MKKWKKIQKSLIRKWRQTQCDWFGHQPVTVIEERWRGKQNILNRKGGKPRKGGHYVTGYYEKCARCGKKLSNFKDVGNMLKMKFWFEGNQLQPDCNIHGGCKIGSSACHACPHCVRVNSKDQEVLCLGDGSGYKEVKLEELRVGDRFKTVKNVYGTLYTVREIKSGKILVDSDVTSMSVIKNFDKVFLLPISE